MHIQFLVLLFFGANICKFSFALKCYGCSISETDVDMDDSCMTDAASVVNCNKPYCVTIRQEYKDPTGKLASLFKGCQDKPEHMNDIIEDETYRYYYYGCQIDLCNKGPGKDTTEETKYLGDKSTIYSPGTGTAASLPRPPTSLYFLSVLALLRLGYFHFN